MSAPQAHYQITFSDDEVEAIASFFGIGINYFMLLMARAPGADREIDKAMAQLIALRGTKPQTITGVIHRMTQLVRSAREQRDQREQREQREQRGNST